MFRGLFKEIFAIITLSGEMGQVVKRKACWGGFRDTFHVRRVSPVIGAPRHTAIRFNHFVLSQIVFLAVNFDNGVP